MAALPVATVRRGDGKVISFALSGSSWVSWADVNDRLTELKDGGGIRTGWRFFSAAMVAPQIFNVYGNLATVTTHSGAILSLAYTDGTAQGPNGGVVEGTSTALPMRLLLRATDQFGSVLSFGYNADSRIVPVSRPDGLEHRYSYSPAGNLTTASFPTLTRAASRSPVHARTCTRTRASPAL